MKVSALKVNSAALEEGRWVGDLPGLDGVKFRVRGFGNKDYRRLMTKLQAKVSTADRITGKAAEMSDDLTNQLLVETILLDWSGIEDENENPIPYSKEQALEWLADPDMRKLREGIMVAADVVGDTAAEQAKADAKN